VRFGLRPLCGVPLFSLTLDFRVRNMGSAYYRSGQAARVWGISSHLVRRLCEAGLIEAEQTDGGQWKIRGGSHQQRRNSRDPIPD